MVQNHTPLKIAFIILLSVVIQICGTTLQGQNFYRSVQANSIVKVDATGSLLGTIWLDTQVNGSRETSEQALSDIKIYVTSLDGSRGYIAISDANGIFRLDSIRYGQYDVEYENRSGALIHAGLIEINDANAAGSLQIPVQPTRLSQQPLTRQIFLPLAVK